MSVRPQIAEPASAASPAARTGASKAHPFFGLIDSVIVPEPAPHQFAGSITLREAEFIWTWMGRDLAPDLIQREPADPVAAANALEAQVPELLQRAKQAIESSSRDAEAARRLRVQIGGEEIVARLPVALSALRSRTALEKARTFGRATAKITDETAMVQALKALPTGDSMAAALVMHATISEVSHPGRLVSATVRIANGDTEAQVIGAGLAPLIDAIYAHAQAAIPSMMGQQGPYADIDLVCQALERFHRLIHAVNTYVELERHSRWSKISSALVKTASDLLAPRLREVMPEVNRALRKAREGSDRLDSDAVLAALNGCYVLAKVRDCRESLALNALFTETWTQLGQALETHIQRNLEHLRANPRDKVMAERLDAGIKMVELRFNADYAEVLRRSKETVERRG